VTIWGNRAESLSPYMEKGKQLAIGGRLEWREWEAQDGTKRQALDITAEDVVLLGGKNDGGGGGSRSESSSSGGDNSFVPASSPRGADDDIPF
jgi:single-strand DNA-binding protein